MHAALVTPARAPIGKIHALPGTRLHVVAQAADCTTCGLRISCLPGTMGDSEVSRVEGVVSARRRVKRGAALYRAGDEFQYIYLVRVGFFKTSIVTGDGQAQVTEFPMAGDLIGLDGVGTDRYQTSLIALEDSEVCAIPFAELERVSRDVPEVQHRLLCLMSAHMADDWRMMTLLGTMRAEQRLATFLTRLAARYRKLGYSSTDFVLRMTREDIGSYLGLKLETVSRLFSRFQQAGLILVQQRLIKVLDPDSLRSLTVALA